jgi:HK97 gp10 family phage protein
MIKPTFQTPDFRKAILQIKDIGGKKMEEAEDEIRDAADRIVQVAKNTAPVNEGALRREISAKQITALQYEIVADTKYAAFLEFGTRTLVNIPPGAEEIAAEARNIKGGSIKDMERAIRRWVKLKGLAGTYSVKTRRRTGSKSVRKSQDDQIVFLIMRKLLRVGVKPQPFFYPSIQKETPRLGKELDKILLK